MTITRRRMLVGATGVAAAAFTHRFAAPTNVGTLVSPQVCGAARREVLILHDGSTSGLLFVRQLRASAGTAGAAEVALQVLTIEGFKQTGALIEGSRGKTLVALFDDAETLVVEALFHASSVVGLDRRRYGRQALLTVRL